MSLWVTMLWPVRVTQAERFVGVEEVFDLSVAHALHTFVADGVVVHNKQPVRARCPLPAADGARYTEYNQCECGPLIPTLESSAVFCDPDSGAPWCGCSAGDDSSWRTAVGTSDTALRDGEWWTRVERDGPGDVLRVTALPDPRLPVLPGSPNVLTINELGDGSAGFLVRELLPGVEFAWGSLWFWKDGTFPHALGLGASSAVLLGVDEDHAWFQPGPGERRWVASGIPSRAWVKLNWSVDLRGDGGYSFSGWFEREDGSLGALQAEDTGESLDDFYRDGGLFAAGDAGAPLALVLGLRSAVDGGSGVLRVTGVVFNR